MIKSMFASDSIFQKRWVIGLIAVLLLAGAFRIFVAHQWANDAPDDSKTYARLARNVLEQHTFSDSEAAPYPPTLIQLHGYPFFLASIYKDFGQFKNVALR